VQLIDGLSMLEAGNFTLVLDSGQALSVYLVSMSPEEH
jgi:hypothetical protein